MGYRLLYDAAEDKAVIYDSTTDVAFGPVIYGCECECSAEDLAEKFLFSLSIKGKDPRHYTPADLVREYGRFFKQHNLAGSSALDRPLPPLTGRPDVLDAGSGVAQAPGPEVSEVG